jgi:hypothetical protein
MVVFPQKRWCDWRINARPYVRVRPAGTFFAGLAKNSRAGAASGSSPPKAASFSAVMLGVLLRSVLVMLGRVQGMPMRDLGMVRRLLVISRFMVLGGLAMMLGRVLVVVRGILMVLMNLVTAHRSLPG